MKFKLGLYYFKPVILELYKLILAEDKYFYNKFQYQRLITFVISYFARFVKDVSFNYLDFYIALRFIYKWILLIVFVAIYLFLFLLYEGNLLELLITLKVKIYNSSYINFLFFLSLSPLLVH